MISTPTAPSRENPQHTGLLLLDVVSAEPGATVGFRGLKFNPSHTGWVKLNDVRVADVRADENGTFRGTFTAPSTEGEYEVLASVGWILDDAELVVMHETPVTPVPVPPPVSGVVVFDGAFHKGALGYENFPGRIHPERIRRVDDPRGVIDPRTGQVRKVLKFKVFEGDIGPTENPRAQIETPAFWPLNTTYFVGHSLMYAENWPQKLMDRAWVANGGGGPWGPPFDGPGPSGTRLESSIGRRVQRLNRSNSINWPAGSRPDVAYSGELAYDIRGIWRDRVLEYRTGSAVNDMKGYVRLWENTGKGWVPRTFYRDTARATTRLAISNPDSSNRDMRKGRSSLSLYYRRHRYGSDGSLTLFHGHFQIGTSFSAVMPRSYDHPMPAGVS